MKIAIISHWGDGLALGLKLMIEGHDVSCYVKDEKYNAILQGAFEHHKSIDSVIKWKPDFAFADQTELSVEMTALDEAQISNFGGASIHDFLEHKRFDAQDLAHKCGVPIPVTVGFYPEQTKKAMDFLNKADSEWIIKFDKGDSASSFMARSNEDIQHFLEQHPPKGQFILQERVKAVAEINTEMWFSHGKPIGLTIGGLEQKKWLAGNLGQNVGCASNISWVYKSVPTIARHLFTHKLMNVLKEYQYSGALDMAAIIDEKGKPYFIEFTPRLGYSAIYDMQELLNVTLGDLFGAVVLGTKINGQYFKSDFGCSIPISIAPYPYEWSKMYIADEQIKAKDTNIIEHFWPYDAKIDGSWDAMSTAGVSGLLGYVTASGKTPKDASDLAMKRVKSFEISDIQYRIDSGMQAEKLKDLKKFGYDIA